MNNKYLFLIFKLSAILIFSMTACSSGRASSEQTEVSSENETAANYFVNWMNEFQLLPQDKSGWTVVTPSNDSRLIYVSSSSGNESTARYYSVDDREIGRNPFKPSGSIHPYASIEKAYKQLRAGYPDYLILKRGETFDFPVIGSSDSQFSLLSGRNASERTVLTSYGPDTTRPVINYLGTAKNIIKIKKKKYLAIMGIAVKDERRNPGGASFNRGIDRNGFILEKLSDILIENCRTQWVQNAIRHSERVVLRRNVISHSYPESRATHVQGLSGYDSSTLLEENIFYHNGWYDGAGGALGQATKYNHNTYFKFARNTIFRKNLFLSPSSINNKFTANQDGSANVINSFNILLDNNFYFEGEVAVSLGGNTDKGTGPRWENILIVNNVFNQIGKTRPTRRNLAWGLLLSDWKGGLIANNLFTDFGDSDVVTNVVPYISQGDMTEIVIDGNIFYKLEGGSSRSFVRIRDYDENSRGPEEHGPITFTNNEIYTDSENLALLDLNFDAVGSSQFAGNYYFTQKDADQWFIYFGDSSGLPSEQDYRDTLLDESSVFGSRSYTDPDRTLSSYYGSLGYANKNSFIEALLGQRKGNWDDQLTAKAVNEYFREGFCIQGNYKCR